jgi:hypothetical protein
MQLLNMAITLGHIPSTSLCLHTLQDQQWRHLLCCPGAFTFCLCGPHSQLAGQPTMFACNHIQYLQISPNLNTRMLYTFTVTEAGLDRITDHVDAQWPHRYIWSVQRSLIDDWVVVVIDCDEPTAVFLMLMVGDHQ